MVDHQKREAEVPEAPPSPAPDHDHTEIDSMRRERNELRAELLRTQKKLAAAVTARERLEHQLQEQQRDAEETYRKAEQHSAKLSQELELLRQNLRQLSASSERLARDNANLEVRVAALRDARDQGDVELARERERLAAANAACEDLGARLQHERSKAEENASKSAQDAAALTEERDLLRENLEQTRAETQRILAEKSELEARVDPSGAESTQKHLLRAQLDAVNRQLDEARGSRQQRESLLGMVILKLAAQLREARALEKHARHELARLHNSTSWKVTRPIRALRRGFGRS